MDSLDDDTARMNSINKYRNVTCATNPQKGSLPQQLFYGHHMGHHVLAGTLS